MSGTNASTARGSGSRSGDSVNPHLRQVIRSFKGALKSVFVFSFFINMLMLAVPIYLLQIYSKVIPNHSLDTLYFLTAIMIVALLTLGYISALRRRILAKLGAWFENQLGDHLLGSAIKRSSKKHRPSVDILRDLSRLRQFISSSSVIAILDLPWTPVYIVVLYLLHPYVGLLVLAGVVLLLGLAVANQYVTRNIVKASDAARRETMDAASSYVRNADVIQAMGMQSAVLGRWRRQHDASLAQSHDGSALTARLASLARLTRLLLQVAVISLAAWLILQAELSGGALIACLLLFRRAVAPLEQSIASWESVIKARSSFRNVSFYLDRAPTLDKVEALPVPDGGLSVERVSYRHSGTRKAILSRVSLRAAPGDVLAIVGETAAGKSTLTRILVGLSAPASGRVTLDGFDLAQWPREELGKHIGYLPQDVELFPGTIRENIARLEDGDIDKVIEAARLANAHELIQRLPDGYDTDIGDNGNHLSGGQRQRIALARVFYGSPRLVVLDEPDANLDTEGRAALVRALHNLKDQGAIVILVTHQPNAQQFVDRVYALKNGVLERVDGEDSKHESVVHKLQRK